MTSSITKSSITQSAESSRSSIISKDNCSTRNKFLCNMLMVGGIAISLLAIFMIGKGSKEDRIKPEKQADIRKLKEVKTKNEIERESISSKYVSSAAPAKADVERSKIINFTLKEQESAGAGKSVSSPHVDKSPAKGAKRRKVKTPEDTSYKAPTGKDISSSEHESKHKDPNITEEKIPHAEDDVKEMRDDAFDSGDVDPEADINDDAKPDPLSTDKTSESKAAKDTKDMLGTEPLKTNAAKQAKAPMVNDDTINAAIQEQLKKFNEAIDKKFDEKDFENKLETMLSNAMKNIMQNNDKLPTKREGKDVKDSSGKKAPKKTRQQELNDKLEDKYSKTFVLDF